METVLITGGSRGIGAECVRLFAKNSFRTVFFYKSSDEAAKALAAETGALAVRADVSDSAAVEKAVSKLGDIDVLVNNAGVSHSGLFTDMSAEEWDAVFAVNMSGAANCCRAVLPGMIRRKRGSIVSVSSVWGQTGGSCEVCYSASKAALIGFTKALAKELGPSGIRVNCVAPGVIDTDMNSALGGSVMDGLRESTPLMRLGTPEDVARSIYFLASDSADFITGQVLGVNGGFFI